MESSSPAIQQGAKSSISPHAFISIFSFDEADWTFKLYPALTVVQLAFHKLLLIITEAL